MTFWMTNQKKISGPQIQNGRLPFGFKHAGASETEFSSKTNNIFRTTNFALQANVCCKSLSQEMRSFTKIISRCVQL